MVKKQLKVKLPKTRVKTRSVNLSQAELEIAYVACSNVTVKNTRTQTKLVNKLRVALLNSVLNR